jgi:hydrogenase expression/formation protein HypC
MKIVELHEKDVAVVESDGARARISTALLREPAIGEYVIIHAGFAIERLDEKEANIRIDLYKELAELEKSGKVTE